MSLIHAAMMDLAKGCASEYNRLRQNLRNLFCKALGRSGYAH